MSAALLAAFALLGIGTADSLAAPPDLTSIPYTATYTDELYGPVTCVGEHQTSSRFPGTETTGGRDVWRCTSTTGAPLTNAVPRQTVRKNVGSDYFFFVKGIEVIGTAKEHISANGRYYRAVAYYPWP
ncbi:MAG TPA: hypothetical protein VNV44_09655 [Solirubrobacteraceae bacterium]|nr:hypothetical protein [Solirubrobacteraceae bacterium]